MNRLTTLAAACALASCASPQHAPIGYDLPTELPRARRAQAAQAAPEDIVARSAGPVRVLKLPEKTELDEREFARELLEAEATCAGEEHAVGTHQFAEVWLLDRLAQRAQNIGLELGLGLEMFQSAFQPALSAYQRGDLDEMGLLRNTEYEERWGYPFQYYRPLVERAKRLRLPLLALNARREVTRAVAKDGLDSLDSRLAYELPALNLSDERHRERFEARMHGHPGLSQENLQRYYEAQVVWDETMADRSASWLTAHAPVRRLLIVAGQAHCERSAIPARLERRGKYRVRNVLLATETPDAEVAGEFDYAVIVGKPDDE